AVVGTEVVVGGEVAGGVRALDRGRVDGAGLQAVEGHAVARGEPGRPGLAVGRRRLAEARDGGRHRVGGPGDLRLVVGDAGDVDA
ncbi:hypothetical protein DF186_20020, partial [Enterococcus hirae]